MTSPFAASGRMIGIFSTYGPFYDNFILNFGLLGRSTPLTHIPLPYLTLNPQSQHQGITMPNNGQGKGKRRSNRKKVRVAQGMKQQEELRGVTMSKKQEELRGRGRGRGGEGR